MKTLIFCFQFPISTSFILWSIASYLFTNLKYQNCYSFVFCTHFFWKVSKTRWFKRPLTAHPSSVRKQFIKIQFRINHENLISKIELPSLFFCGQKAEHSTFKTTDWALKIKSLHPFFHSSMIHIMALQEKVFPILLLKSWAFNLYKATRW